MTFPIGARVRFISRGDWWKEWSSIEWTIIGLEQVGVDSRISYRLAVNGREHVWARSEQIAYSNILDEMAAIT